MYFYTLIDKDLFFNRNVFFALSLSLSLSLID